MVLSMQWLKTLKAVWDFIDMTMKFWLENKFFKIKGMKENTCTMMTSSVLQRMNATYS